MQLLKKRVGTLPRYALGIGEPSPLVSPQRGLEPGFPWGVPGGLLSRCCQFYLLQHFPHRGKWPQPTVGPQEKLLNVE